MLFVGVLSTFYSKFEERSNAKFNRSANPGKRYQYYTYTETQKKSDYDRKLVDKVQFTCEIMRNTINNSIMFESLYIKIIYSLVALSINSDITSPKYDKG